MGRRGVAVGATSAAQATAQMLLAARSTHRVIPLNSWKHTPSCLSEAYAAQAALLAAAKYGKRTGYKIGATNAGARQTLRLFQPFYGVLHESFTLPNSCIFQASALYQCLVEPEVAIVLGEDVDASQAAVDANRLRAATAKVLPAIEIVDSPFGDRWKEAGGLNLIADNGAHGRFVIGVGSADAATFDSVGIPVTLEARGRVQREGTGAAVDGGCFEAAAWLANTLGASGIALRKGEILTTGTKTVPWPGKAGEEVVARFAGLGTVAVRFN